MSDQAEQLRKLMAGQHSRAKIIAVASGKGGVGKSNFSLNMGIRLVSKGQKVLLLDADLGLANLDILMGIKCRANLSHVINGQVSLSDAIVQGPGGIDLIPGASGIHDIVNMSGNTKRELVKSLQKLESWYDLIIIDTQAGVSDNVMSFIQGADETIVVSTGEPTSMADAYALIKMVVKNKQNTRLSLVMNMMPNEPEGRKYYEKLAMVCERFLQFHLDYAGSVLYDNLVEQAVQNRQPFILAAPDGAASRSLKSIATAYIPTPSVTHVQTQGEGFFGHIFGMLGFSSGRL